MASLEPHTTQVDGIPVQRGNLVGWWWCPRTGKNPSAPTSVPACRRGMIRRYRRRRGGDDQAGRPRLHLPTATRAVRRRVPRSVGGAAVHAGNRARRHGRGTGPARWRSTLRHVLVDRRWTSPRTRASSPGSTTPPNVAASPATHQRVDPPDRPAVGRPRRVLVPGTRDGAHPLPTLRSGTLAIPSPCRWSQVRGAHPDIG